MIFIFAFSWVIALIINLPILFLWGWSITKLWDWFVLPLGANNITLVQAMGLQVLFNLIKGSKMPKAKDGTLKEGMLQMAWHVMYSISAVLVGYLLHTYF